MSDNETGSRFIGAGELSLELGISESTLMAWVRTGQFPAPLRLGKRKMVWLRTEFELYVENRIAERDHEGLKNENV